MLRSPQYRRYNEVPILVLSATFSGADAEQLITDLGADAFLPAPYKPSDLRNRLNNLLGDGEGQAKASVLIITSGAP